MRWSGGLGSRSTVRGEANAGLCAALGARHCYQPRFADRCAVVQAMGGYPAPAIEPWRAGGVVKRGLSPMLLVRELSAPANRRCPAVGPYLGPLFDQVALQQRCLEHDAMRQSRPSDRPRWTVLKEVGSKMSVLTCRRTRFGDESLGTLNPVSTCRSSQLHTLTLSPESIQASLGNVVADDDLLCRLPNLLMMYGGSNQPLLRNATLELVKGHRCLARSVTLVDVCACCHDRSHPHGVKLMVRTRLPFRPDVPSSSLFC